MSTRRTSPQDLVEQALAASTSEHCVVVVEESHSANLRWAINTLTTNGAMHSIDVTVVAFQGAGNASVSGSVASVEQVRALVAQADAAAAVAEPADDRADLVEGEAASDWDDPAGTTSIAVFDAFARQLGEAFGEAEAGSRLLYGFVFHEVRTTYLGSSTGLRLRHEQPTGHYGCTGKDAALTTSAWVGGASRDFADVDATAMAAELSTRIGWGERRVDLPAGRYDTVLPPTAVSDLLVLAYWNAAARHAADGIGPFADPSGGTRIGQRLVRDDVTWSSDPGRAPLQCEPFVVNGASSAYGSVYDNGLPLEPTAWIADGELRALMQTRRTAAETGQAVTPGIDNLVLEVAGGAGTAQDLAAEVEDGLLLTCLWYIREVDEQSLLLTGLTRDGVYRVEGGEITGAVNNFRFNESPLDLLRRFSHAGETVPSFSREWGEDNFSRTATPALRVPDFNMSSVSQAL
ncbi:metallopeptidase TldD-related protein [Nocardioides marmoraquaticus]